MESRSSALPLLAAATAGGLAVYAFQRLVRPAKTPQTTDAQADGPTPAPGAAQLWRPPPHPDWQPPQPLPAPFGTARVHSVDPSSTSAEVLYPLVISAVVPRPIAFVSTEARGSRNLAPYR